MTVKTIKLSAAQSPRLQGLIAAQAKHRSAASRARALESDYKSRRDEFLALLGQESLAILQAQDGYQVKFERKASHMRARPASESVRWDVAEVG